MVFDVLKLDLRSWVWEYSKSQGFEESRFIEKFCRELFYGPIIPFRFIRGFNRHLTLSIALVRLNTPLLIIKTIISLYCSDIPRKDRSSNRSNTSTNVNSTTNVSTPSIYKSLPAFASEEPTPREDHLLSPLSPIEESDCYFPSYDKSLLMTEDIIFTSPFTINQLFTIFILSDNILPTILDNLLIEFHRYDIAYNIFHDQASLLRAMELLDHYHPGEKVVIVSNSLIAEQYINEWEQQSPFHYLLCIHGQVSVDKMKQLSHSLYNKYNVFASQSLKELRRAVCWILAGLDLVNQSNKTPAINPIDRKQISKQLECDKRAAVLGQYHTITGNNNSNINSGIVHGGNNNAVTSKKEDNADKKNSLNSLASNTNRYFLPNAHNLGIPSHVDHNRPLSLSQLPMNDYHSKTSSYFYNNSTNGCNSGGIGNRGSNGNNDMDSGYSSRKTDLNDEISQLIKSLSTIDRPSETPVLSTHQYDALLQGRLPATPLPDHGLLSFCGLQGTGIMGNGVENLGQKTNNRSLSLHSTSLEGVESVGMTQQDNHRNHSTFNTGSEKRLDIQQQYEIYYKGSQYDVVQIQHKQYVLLPLEQLSLL